MQEKEIFISVDVETAGPIPGEFSLLTIGACNVYKPDNNFECKLKPTTMNVDAEALAVTGLSLDELKVQGLDVLNAMTQFRSWIESNLPEKDSVPVFVGLNAPFDWSFINYYFHLYLGYNPFGFSALDIKALYMGATGCHWGETKSSLMSKKLQAKQIGNHDALQDAQYQAELFRLIQSLKKQPR